MTGSTSNLFAPAMLFRRRELPVPTSSAAARLSRRAEIAAASGTEVRRVFLAASFWPPAGDDSSFSVALPSSSLVSFLCKAKCLCAPRAAADVQDARQPAEPNIFF